MLCDVIQRVQTCSTSGWLLHFNISLMANKITVPVLFGEKEELYTITVSATEYERIMNNGTSIIKDSLNL